eukprot:SAG25_NODE_3320_length_1130_cov_1.634336_2_plen_98_part_00
MQGSSCKALATVTWHFVGPPRSCLGCCCSAPYHGRISSSHHYNNSCTAAPLYSVDAVAWHTNSSCAEDRGGTVWKLLQAAPYMVLDQSALAQWDKSL